MEEIEAAMRMYKVLLTHVQLRLPAHFWVFAKKWLENRILSWGIYTHPDVLGVFPGWSVKPYSGMGTWVDF